MRISFVLPAHDESESLPQLLDEIAAALDALGGDGEILVVDDASSDATPALLAERRRREPRLRPLRMRRRSGQSAALAAGFHRATGDVLVTLDADLQNDPRDAKLLVDALAAADLVCGVRRGRRDTAWRRFSSWIANTVRRALLHDPVRDTGCGLKAFRAETARRLVRFNGWHRFHPALAVREGMRVVEVEVSHRPRLHGRTHYGTLDRLLRGIYDLFGMMWLIRRRLPPPEEAEELDPAPPHGGGRA